jgi:integrase
LIPYFKSKKLTIEEIRPKHIKEYYIFKSTKGRKDGNKGGLSHDTLKHPASVLKLIFSEAVELEEISQNPAEKVHIPKAKVEDKKDCLDDAVFLTAEQANTLLEKIDGSFIQPLVYVALYYGLRRSELLGLRWSAVDFENDTLTINHTVVKHQTIIAKDRTKSKTSNGTYALLPDVKEILLRLKAQETAYRAEFGNMYIDTDYIFKWQNGKTFRPDYITKKFQKTLEEVGLPKMRLHDLRHSCASILYDKGWNVKDIQEWLRHSDIETTMNIYTHISEQKKKILAKDMQGTFKLQPNRSSDIYCTA